MKKHVNEEVTEFLKFLQNSAKKCAQDYNMLSDNAHLFTEVKKNHIYLSCQVIGKQNFKMCDDFPKVYINVVKLETKLYIGLLFIMYLSDGNTRNNNISKSDTTAYSYIFF